MNYILIDKDKGLYVSSFNDPKMHNSNNFINYTKDINNAKLFTDLEQVIRICNRYTNLGFNNKTTNL